MTKTTTIVIRDECGDTVMSLDASRSQIFGGYVTIDIGGFKLEVSAEVATEIGTQFLNASASASGVKVPA